MKPKLHTILAFPVCLALAACEPAEPTDTSTVAEDFSARINGPQGAQERAEANPLSQRQVVAPPVVDPLPQPAQPDPASGEPQTASADLCGAELMAPFIGRPADDATRAAVLEAASDINEVRFIPPGLPTIQPDAASARLNLMIDNIGVIRDARCG